MLLLFPGKFGTGIQSYFSFLRFLVLLNFLIFILMFGFVTFPTVISKYGIFNSSFAKISPKNTGKHLLCVLLFVRFPYAFSFSLTHQDREILCCFHLFVSCKNMSYLN